ncbi:MAG: SDR family oxidoreductase [Rhodospirillales bacterium]|jgi:NAD(P)-dependent dehydrogenase (short-subunit alcohol dehydrogenase family)|nr:SDR family oxidoreductase [Rhodospirillales bacterium]
MANDRDIRDLMALTGRVALVTGGAGHIGRAVAAGLAELGAAVALTDLDDGACRAAARQLTERFPGTPTLAQAVDLADEAAVKALPERVAAELGGLDILVNSAAFVGDSKLTGWAVPFEEQSPVTWRAAIEVNLTAVFVLVQAARPWLEKSGKGSVVNVASIYGMVGPDLGLYEGTRMGNPAAYGAAKGGLLQLTRWLACVMAPAVRVNAITPGGIQRGQSETFVGRYEARTPLGRMGTEEDMKGAVAYLAGDLSAYVTGHNLVVDGGWTAW